MTRTCRYCRQPIAWAQRHGRWIPLDPEPHPEGRFIKTGTTYKHLVGVDLETVRHWAWHLYQPHQCPTTTNPARREERGPDVH